MCSSLVSGIISGVLASFFLYVILFRIKPKIKISDEICYDTHRKIFQIKIVNLTRTNLVNVKYTLHACYRFGDGILDVQVVEPLKDKFEFIQAYSKSDCNDCNNDYAVRISYDLSPRINDGSVNSESGYFLFSLYAEHSFSGSAIFLQKEYPIDKIVCGQFQLGETTTILREKCKKVFSSCKHTCIQT